jgi:hypothetical protein
MRIPDTTVRPVPWKPRQAEDEEEDVEEAAFTDSTSPKGESAVILKRRGATNGRDTPILDRRRL